MTPFVPESKTNARGQLDWNSVMESLCTNEHRNKLIIDLVKANQNNKILLLTRRVEHAKRMVSMLTEEGIKSTIMAGSVKNALESRVIVGTVPKIGTGWDESNYFKEYSGEKVNLLILTLSIKELQTFEQVRGRVMRSDTPSVIYFVDNHPTIKKHFNGLKGWINETGGQIEEVHVGAPVEDVGDVEIKYDSGDD
jgi:hypothetical protein